MDNLAPQTRRRTMASVHSRDTSPELLVRKGLFARGLRYRLYRRDLPGKPDLVFPKHGAVIFVNGCYWHGHKCARGNRIPKTNTCYWLAKIERNLVRDQYNLDALAVLGWRVGVIWECAISGKSRDISATLDNVAAWLKGASID